MSEHVLEKYAFFRNGKVALRKDFIASAKSFSAESGQPLYYAGDSAKRVYFVGDGALNVYVSGYSGRNVTLYNVAMGELCPINLGAILSTGTVLASAKTKSGYEGAVVSATDFRRILGTHPEFRQFVIACVVTKFESIVRQISEVTTRSVDSRLKRYFDDHIDEFDEHGFLRVTNEQIGTQIGASREVVNRKLRSMQKAGIVELDRGRIRLLRPDKILHPKSQKASDLV